MAGFTKGRTKSKRTVKKPLDYHEGLSINQVEIILTELGLSIDKFNEWIGGQTCPILIRHDPKRRNTELQHITIPGIYEYDLFRWISNQKKGTALIWD